MWVGEAAVNAAVFVCACCAERRAAVGRPRNTGNMGWPRSERGGSWLSPRSFWADPGPGWCCAWSAHEPLHSGTGETHGLQQSGGTLSQQLDSTRVFVGHMSHALRRIIMSKPTLALLLYWTILSYF